MKTCPACAEEIQPRTTVCPWCGEKLAGQPERRHSSKPLGDDPMARMLLPVGRSGWAIAAGYLGLFSLICFPAPLAVIVSGVALWHLKSNPELHGMGRAVFGLVAGLLGSGVLLFGLLSAVAGR